MSAEKDLKYAVDYGTLDPFKVHCQESARETAANLAGTQYTDVPDSRGESVTLIEAPDRYLALLAEGLGTKILVADAMWGLTRVSYDFNIGQDTAAMILNDMATSGARAIGIAMYLAMGDGEWLKNKMRSHRFALGWERACNYAGCVWMGGETSQLRDIIVPGTVDAAGAAFGEIFPKSHRIKGDIQDGDAIVLVEGTGPHANGITMLRDLAAKLPEGYLTQIGSSRLFGEAILEPTPIYGGFVLDCIKRGARIHYAVNITGHGWRKLMRAVRPFTYEITRLPKQQAIFEFLLENGVTERKAYETFNMGPGFALIMPQEDVSLLSDAFYEPTTERTLQVINAGTVHKGPKQVVIAPKTKNIVFGEDELKIR